MKKADRQEKKDLKGQEELRKVLLEIYNNNRNKPFYINKYEQEISEFIRISRKDLKASIMLHGEGFYSHSVYYLQQFFEKMSKAYLLSIGSNDYEKIMTHDAWLKALKSEYFKTGIRDLEILINNTIDVDYKLSKNIDFLQNLKEKQVLIRKLKPEKISSVINTVQKLRKELRKGDFVDDIIKTHKINLLGRIFNQLKKFSGNKMTEEELFNSLKGEDEIKNFVDELCYSALIMILAIITEPHHLSARYTRTKKGEIYDIKYTNINDNIVKSLPLIFKECNKILRSQNLIFKHKSYK